MEIHPLLLPQILAANERKIENQKARVEFCFFKLYDLDDVKVLSRKNLG